MADIEFPSELVDRQRAADQAWAALEAHRKQVDGQRRQDTPDTPGRPAWTARPMRPWTKTEDAEHQRLMTAAVSAQETLRAALAGARLSPDAATVQGLKNAARAERPAV
ncbi:hypothetical protein [Streptomyces sp. NRRL F-5123]|uniref:hypothetical protein n=1 Tax=Streptomyces sp. NRRL F-5123 TaxID=1463856 RepID=UPI0004E1BDBD|nr:hypothetical protein [Streptomyces sp. NRRL F-5123]